MATFALRSGVADFVDSVLDPLSSEVQIADVVVGSHSPLVGSPIEKYLANRKSGVTVLVEPMRYYPEGELMSHILGYVGRISAEEYECTYFRRLQKLRTQGGSFRQELDNFHYREVAKVIQEAVDNNAMIAASNTDAVLSAVMRAVIEGNIEGIGK